MSAVVQASFATRSGIKEEPVYEQSWMSAPFDDWQGLNQQQYQDSVSQYQIHGKSVRTDVPKGWRRVESARPGRQLYVHVATGTISKFPSEIFDCQQDSWINKEGEKLSDEELKAPDRRVLAIAGPNVKAASSRGPSTKALQAAEAALPPLPVALLFPGQGSQYVGMLKSVKDLPKVKDMLSKAEKILGYDILKLCLEGPESQLEQTQYCQPAMYLAGLAAVEKLRAEQPDRVQRCKAVAGLSLGEYTALTVAGVFSMESGLKLVKLRAEAMQAAAESSAQSMLSVAGLEEATLSALCRECAAAEGGVCQIANFLFPKGFACAGSTAAIEVLRQRALDTPGCMQAKLLKTSGAFHTSLMQGAREQLLEALRGLEGEMKPPRCDVFMNLTAKKIDRDTAPEEIVALLGDQLVSCVQWEPSMVAMINEGIEEFYECGPNKQLKAMLKRISPNAFKATTSVEV